MGMIFTELIPPAILLDHPGITRGEYANLFHQIFIPEKRETKPKDPLNTVGARPVRYANSLYTVARELGLNFSDDYLKFITPKVDSNGLDLRQPILFSTCDNIAYREGDKEKFEVITHDANLLADPRVLVDTFIRTPGYHKGIIYEDQYLEEGIVTEVLSKRLVDNTSYIIQTDEGGHEVRTPIHSDHFYFYDVIAIPINIVNTTHTYPTKTELFKYWPQFKAENMYDFSKPNGNFYVDSHDDKFFWMMRNGRYYLDPKSFDKMPASFNVSYQERPKTELPSWGYTDLVITAEVIKHKAWKLFSRDGTKYLEEFFSEFPDSRKRYQDATFDAHLSISSGRRGISYSDFLMKHLIRGNTSII